MAVLGFGIIEAKLGFQQRGGKQLLLQQVSETGLFLIPPVSLHFDLRFALIAARLQICQCFISPLCCEQICCFTITLGRLTCVKCLLDAIQEAVQVRKLLVAPLFDFDCLAPVVTGFHDLLLRLCLDIGDQLFPGAATIIADFFLNHIRQAPDAGTDSAEQKQQDNQGHYHASLVPADFAFELLQLELKFPDFAA